MSQRVSTLLLVALLGAPGLALFADGVHDEARALADAGDHAGAVERLGQHLKRVADDPLALELMGRSLLALERRDEAAHYLDRAIALYLVDGKKGLAKKLEKPLAEADEHARRRATLFTGIVRDLLRSAERLHDEGNPERALEILRRIEPLARDKNRAAIEALIAEVGAKAEAVDLDAAAAEERNEDGLWPLVVVESDHYYLECNLEREVVELVADTMDDIYANYVQIYFDGDEKKAPKTKATIRIHGTWDDMAALWPGGAPSPGLGGWWSPGSAEVHGYDTRERRGTLDEMLDTLYHEASHQFMSALTRGGGVPAWLNEGTSCFFEGSVAMTDHRVLWPDAALDRLQNLAGMIQSRSGPGLTQVIGYNSPSSYPGDYYAWGWGIVYFLQQWEDPETFEYSYRPLYSRYRSEVIGKTASSRALFDEVFLGDDSPLGHETFAQFEKDWEEWILGNVRPLHFSPLPERRALRQARVDRYMAAASRAAEEGKRAKISEEEYLLRALGDVEYIRTKIDGDSAPTKELLVAQADILERLGREKTAAAMIEQLLEFADDARIELSEEEQESFEKRLQELDKSNYALRMLRRNVKKHTKAAHKLLETYVDGDDVMTLRSYTFAATVSTALGDAGEIAGAAERLRTAAREAGLLLGRVVPIRGKKSDWINVWSTAPRDFGVSAREVRATAVRPATLIDPSVEIRDEYEVRAKLVRGGDHHLGTAHGLVVGGTADTDWAIIGIDADGQVGKWTVVNSSGTARLKRNGTLYLEDPIEPGVDVELAVHVYEDGRITVQVDDQPLLESKLRVELPPVRHVGIFVRDGELALENFVVEMYP